MPEVKTAFLFRSYVKTESNEAIEVALERAERSVDAVFSLGEEYDPVFLVPGSDFGDTDKLIYGHFKGLVPVIKSCGDANSTALNHGMRFLVETGYTNVAIASNKAIPFINNDVVSKADALFRAGCLAVGVVIPELRDFVLAGRIQNTLAFWNLDTILGLKPSGFDSQIGVEEIAVLIRMYREYGPCVGIVNTDSKNSLDVRGSDEARKHHENVLRTKEERHLKEAERVGGSLDEIRKSILRTV